MPARGVYDKQVVHAILDEGFICHVGIVVDGQPFVTPTAYARVGERLYFHGNLANRMLKEMKVCFCFVIVDRLHIPYPASL